MRSSGHFRLATVFSTIYVKMVACIIAIWYTCIKAPYMVYSYIDSVLEPQQAGYKYRVINSVLFFFYFCLMRLRAFHLRCSKT